MKRRSEFQKAIRGFTSILGLIIASHAFGETVEYGDNWKRYTFKPDDFVKTEGSRLEHGWGVTYSDQVRVGCFVASPKKTFLGAGTAIATVRYYADAWVRTENLHDRPTSPLAAVVGSFQDIDGTNRVFEDPTAIQATDLDQWQFFADDGSGGAIFHVESSEVFEKSTKRTFADDGVAKNLSVDVCNVMPQTQLEIAEISILFVKNQ